MRALAEIHNPGQWHTRSHGGETHRLHAVLLYGGRQRAEADSVRPFQLSIIAHAYGMVDDRNLRKVFEELWMMGRKNGKTTVGAALEVDAEYNDGEYAPHLQRRNVERPGDGKLSRVTT
ncbi:MAG: hypothetical protein ACLTMP_09950 [Eggerthella lenta]